MNAPKKIGLMACTAIVAGNMMSSGIAMLPATLAAVGSVTVYSWIITIIGALGLAYVFARLGLEDPQGGGPVAYSQKVAPILGFQAQTLYFHANWIGNVAVGVTSVSYLSQIVPVLQNPIISGIAVIVMTWLLILINLMGAHWIGRLASIGVIFVILPVAATAIFGWWHFDQSIFLANWNTSGKPVLPALISGVLLCIWSFIGIESASVDTDLVEKPSRNVPLSTIGGTLLAAILYILSCTVIMGLFPAANIAKSNAPFSLAVATIFNMPLMGNIVALFTAVACFCSFGSWIMLVAQIGVRAAKDGNLPKIFGETNAHDVPVKGMVMTGIFMTVLMVILTLYHQSTQAVFSEIISIAVLLTVLPYFYSALYLIEITEHTRRGFMRFLAAALTVIFCFAAFFGGSAGALIGTLVLSLGILVFYAKAHPVILGHEQPSQNK